MRKFLLATAAAAGIMLSACQVSNGGDAASAGTNAEWPKFVG
jgi:hypothetical protein